MDRSTEDLGLTPDISRLPSEVRHWIRDGSSNECLDCSAAAVTICVAMFRAGYGVDEVWMVMTDPANGISGTFFKEDGQCAEAYLGLLISEAHEVISTTGQ